MWQYIHTDELYHHGIKGQKWGVRRSKAQLARAAGRKSKKSSEPEHEDYKKAHSPKKVSSMSTKELQERNARLSMEKQYAGLNKKTSKGKAAINAFVASATTLAAVMKAYDVYKKAAGPYVKKAIDKLGNKIVKPT